jgi:hypothetical protein
MKRILFRSICVLVASLIISGAHAATVLLDTGTPVNDSFLCDGDNCGGSNEWTVIDSFSSAGWTVTGFTFRSVESAGSVIGSYLSTDWSVWNSDPFSNVPIASGTATATTSNIGSISGNTAYDFPIDGLNVNLSSGSYWLGYHHDFSIEGTTSAATIGNPGSFMQTDWGTNFRTEEDVIRIFGAVGDLSFQIRGSAIPVPAAVWLFGSALGLLGWMRRKSA